MFSLFEVEFTKRKETHTIDFLYRCFEQVTRTGAEGIELHLVMTFGEAVVIVLSFLRICSFLFPVFLEGLCFWPDVRHEKKAVSVFLLDLNRKTKTHFIIPKDRVANWVI